MASRRLKTPSTRRVQVQSTFTPTIVTSPSLRGHAYSSPSLATPGTSTIPINDDVAERRQRRLDTRTHAAASPSCHTPTTIQDRLAIGSSHAWFDTFLFAVGRQLNLALPLLLMLKFLNIILCVWNYRQRMWGCTVACAIAEWVWYWCVVVVYLHRKSIPKMHLVFD